MQATAWTEEDCAQFLQVDKELLRKLRQRGGGPPFVKVGRAVRYIPAHVSRWLDANASTTTQTEARPVVVS